MSIIFLAGVHGVGKGYLGSLVADELKILHRTASQLIREEKGRDTWDKEKLVVDVEENQLALILAINRLCETNETVLLDGHFVLRDKDGKFVRIAQDVFAELNLAQVIVLSEDSHLIAERIKLRDGLAVTAASVAALAVEEESHAHDICRALGIKLTLLKSPDGPILKRVVSRILKNIKA